MEQYDIRAEKLGLASKEDIKNILSTYDEANVVFVDVRSEAEVAEQSLQGKNVVYVPCTRDDASLLQSKANEVLPDTNGEYFISTVAVLLHHDASCFNISLFCYVCF